MRGKDDEGRLKLRHVGITPAYAGKSRRCRGKRPPPRDHPRVCGEKVRFTWHSGRSEGSPPRMRGKERGSTSRQRRNGITPAYAGKRFQKSLARATEGDHPRVCGEKKVYRGQGLTALGSPPRMRGKVNRNPDAGADTRITPAYAGKRLKRSRSTVSPVAIVPLFPSVCNKPVVSDGSPAVRDAPLFLPAENAVPASPAYNLRSL